MNGGAAMPVERPSRRHACLSIPLGLALLAAVVPPPSALAQADEGATVLPDPATLDAQYETLFAAAVERSDGAEEPMNVLMSWGATLQAAFMAEHVRRLLGAADSLPVDGAAVTERVLARWQELRPESSGPHVMRALQHLDPVEKAAAVAAVLDRFPDDLLAVSTAVQQLLGGDPGRAREVAAGYVDRNPDDSEGYDLLLRTVRDNDTERTAVLVRWAAAVPGDPRLVQAWFGWGHGREDAEGARRVLADFFARRPGGADDLGACLSAARRGGAEFTAPARACVARVAGTPDLPEQTTRQATSALVEMAAADGDWSAMTTALERVEPARRARALTAAASSLEAPARCDEALGLLSAAAAALGGDDDPYSSVASALRRCGERPAAQGMLLGLLHRAPAGLLSGVLRAWGLSTINGVVDGELPPGAVAALEARQAAQPDAEGLYRALDLVYQLDDPDDRRFDLLRRWHERSPDSFGPDQALDLAGELGLRGEPAAAVELLEARFETRADPRVAEALWELYLAAAGAEKAERFAADLAADEERWRSRLGHTLAARSALLRGEVVAAEDRYWQALAGEAPGRELAAELLAVVAGRGEAAEVAAMARRICDETTLGAGAGQTTGCATDLLTRVGRADAAAGLVAARAGDLPDDPGALRDLASTASAAGRADVAEQALRRAIELDPLGETGWTTLGDLFEKQGRVDDLEALLERSRAFHTPPPGSLLRAAGRAAGAADRPERAVELLLEARAQVPEGSRGDYNRGWIDHELRRAYRLLGTTPVRAAARRAAAPSFGFNEPPEVPAGATPGELRRLADALQSGAGGRYDPDSATDLFRRTAAAGDAPAAYRLALLRQLGSVDAAPGEPAVDELLAGSRAAVEALAADGEPYAQYLLGTAALVGLGGAADHAVARRWLERSAAGGESWAAHNLGWMAETGRGFAAADPAYAAAAYRRASEAGNTRSMVDLARHLLTFEARGEPCAEGLGWLERSAAAGNAAAAAFLGKLLFYGRGDCVARNAAAARRWLEAGAASRQPGAAFDLAMALATGGSDADRARGVRLLDGAVVDDREPLAAETLALMYAAGVAARRDPAAARRYLDEAARLGSDGFPRLRGQLGDSPVFDELVAAARPRLAALAEKGDPAAAAFLARGFEVGLFVHAGGGDGAGRTAALARHAAEAGEPQAMRLLAAAYQHGRGVEPDAVEALRWRRRCAEAGESFCMMFLGNDLLAGEKLSRDVEAGLGWLRRAAEAGNWWAVGQLAEVYANGEHGVPRDLDEAAVWKRLRADLGDPDAAGWLAHHGYR